MRRHPKTPLKDEVVECGGLRNCLNAEAAPKTQGSWPNLLGSYLFLLRDPVLIGVVFFSLYYLVVELLMVVGFAESRQ